MYKHIVVNKQDILKVKAKFKEKYKKGCKELKVCQHLWDEKAFKKAIKSQDTNDGLWQAVSKIAKDNSKNFEIVCICEMALLYLEEHKGYGEFIEKDTTAKNVSVEEAEKHMIVKLNKKFYEEDKECSSGGEK